MARVMKYEVRVKYRQWKYFKRGVKPFGKLVTEKFKCKTISYCADKSFSFEQKGFIRNIWTKQIKELHIIKI